MSNWPVIRLSHDQIVCHLFAAFQLNPEQLLVILTSEHMNIAHLVVEWLQILMQFEYSTEFKPKIHEFSSCLYNILL